MKNMRFYKKKIIFISILLCISISSFSQQDNQDNIIKAVSENPRGSDSLSGTNNKSIYNIITGQEQDFSNSRVVVHIGPLGSVMTKV